ncbi:MAG: 6-carboxytetrahydropterin synthase QueD [Candidatus Omnitrophica bacterium]|nr:6-carboxytetrahydropterin synthase QueD [Candidatus Omnitrophota bacterium]
MYSIKVLGSFSAAHNLRGYKGKCEDLHGHNWRVELVLSSSKLDKIGMVMDFKCLKAELNSVLEEFDHKYLNNHVFFKKVNPTSENIAKYIFDKIRKRGVRAESVTIWENDTSAATYRIK